MRRTAVIGIAFLLTTAWLGWRVHTFTQEYRLWDAARSGEHDTVRRLLERGVDPDASWQGLTALGAAAFFGDDETAVLLLTHGADPNRAWRQALHQDRPAILRAMLAHGLSVRGTTGREALLTAVGAGYLDDVQLLLNAGVDLKTAGTGQAALKAARNCGRAQTRARMVRLLRSAGSR